MFWLLILFTSLLIWVWWDGLGAKEIARARCVQVCRERDVLFDALSVEQNIAFTLITNTKMPA